MIIQNLNTSFVSQQANNLIDGDLVGSNGNVDQSLIQLGMADDYVQQYAWLDDYGPYAANAIDDIIGENNEVNQEVVQIGSSLTDAVDQEAYDYGNYIDYIEGYYNTATQSIFQAGLGELNAYQLAGESGNSLYDGLYGEGNSISQDISQVAVSLQGDVEQNAYGDPEDLEGANYVYGVFGFDDDYATNVVDQNIYQIASAYDDLWQDAGSFGNLLDEYSTFDIVLDQTISQIGFGYNVYQDADTGNAFAEYSSEVGYSASAFAGFNQDIVQLANADGVVEQDAYNEVWNEIYVDALGYLDQSIIQSALTDGDIYQWAENNVEYEPNMFSGEIEQSFDQNAMSNYGDVSQYAYNEVFYIYSYDASLNQFGNQFAGAQGQVFQESWNWLYGGFGEDGLFVGQYLSQSGVSSLDDVEQLANNMIYDEVDAYYPTIDQNIIQLADGSVVAQYADNYIYDVYAAEYALVSQDIHTSAVWDVALDVEAYNTAYVGSNWEATVFQSIDSISLATNPFAAGTIYQENYLSPYYIGEDLDFLQIAKAELGGPGAVGYTWNNIVV